MGSADESQEFQEVRVKDMGYQNTIAQQANALADRFASRDPFLIARLLGIHIKHTDRFKRLRGMYFIVCGERYIALNNANSEQMNRIVCAHEIGHDQLHRAFAEERAMQEFMLYDMATRPEYEANVFAANLLLEDETVLGYITEGYDCQQIAALMETDINLVSLKVNSLIQEGYHLQEQGHQHNFLK